MKNTKAQTLLKISNKIKDLSKIVSSEDMERVPRDDLRKRYKKTKIDKESKEDCKDNFSDPDLKE